METQANYWQRSLHSSRVSRRRLLGGASAAGLGAAGLALVGCGDDGNGKATPGGGGTGTQAAGSPTAAQVKRDGIYRARQATPLATINPWGGLDTASTWGMYLPIYDRLIVTPGDTMVTENFLAEKIEVADPLHFTIKIKPAVFQNRPPVNGRAVTAEDIKGTMMGVQAAPKLPKDPWWNDVLDKVEVLDEKTVTFTLKKPDASTFYATKLAGPWHALVIPREHTADPSLMDKDLIGSGLFEFVSHQDGANLKVKRNETYREKDKGLPNLAALETKLIQEQAAALAAFSAKEIDSYVPVNKLEKDQLVQQFGKSVDIETIPSKSVWTVIVRKDGQWADARVQQAFSMALDRKEMIALIGFGEGQITGPVPPYFANYALTEKEIADTCGKFDPAEARKLLAATGFDTSKEYRLKFATVGNPNWEKFVEIVGTQLQKNLGVKTKAIGEDYATWLNKSLLAGDYDLNTYPSTSYEDPTSYAGFWDLTVGGRPNHTGLKSQELADLLTKQAAQYDNKARQQQVKDLQKKAWEVGNPFIPTFVGVGYSAVWNYVKGRVPASRGALSYLAGTTYIDKG